MPTHTHAQIALNANKEIVFELFLSIIIQNWFDFLYELYEKALTESLSYKSSYTINLSKIDIRLEQPQDPIIEQIKKSSLRNFDFQTAQDKFKEISKILNRTANIPARQLQLIRENVEIRNILQHHDGIIGADALQRLGNSLINEDHGSNLTPIRANQKITRTAYDMENLIDSLIDLADFLVP